MRSTSPVFRAIQLSPHPRCNSVACDSNALSMNCDSCTGTKDGTRTFLQMRNMQSKTGQEQCSLSSTLSRSPLRRKYLNRGNHERKAKFVCLVKHRGEKMGTLVERQKGDHCANSYRETLIRSIGLYSLYKPARMARKESIVH